MARYSGFARRLRHIGMVLIAVVAILLVPIDGAAEPKAKTKKPATARTKSPTKRGTSSTMIVRKLEKVFKLWDSDNDGSVDRDELKKFYHALTAKAKKKLGAPQIGNQDLPEPVLALLENLDRDQDNQITGTEFSAWAPAFADHLVKVSQLQDKVVVTKQRLAELQVYLASRKPDVTALDAAASEPLRMGVIRYELELKGLEAEFQKLDTEGGHAVYREFIRQQLFR